MALVSILDKFKAKGDILDTLKECDRSPAASLFRRVITETAGSKNGIEGFNNWVDNIMPQQVISKSFVSDDGVSVTFSDVILHRPVRVEDNKEIPLYPHFCREHHVPYSGKLEVTCTTQKNKDKRVIRVILGYIPIMLGSNKCNLYGKNIDELVNLGECITDPFGYFIVSSEWALIAHDKKRHNLPLISFIKTSKDNQLSISNQYAVSKFLQICFNKRNNSIEMSDPLSNKEESITTTFSIFVVYKIVAGLEPEEAINKYILRFIPKNLHRRAKNTLSFSVFDYRTINDPLLYIYNIRNEYKNIKDDQRKKILENIDVTLEKEIFVTIEDENREVRVEKKMLTLSYMVAKFILFKLHKIGIDNPDSWMNKRFDNAHKHMEGLFNSIMNNILNKCKNKNRRGGKSGTENFMDFGNYLNSKSKDEFRKNFESSFNTTNWGIKEMGLNRENYREMVRRDTPLALWAQIVKNTNNISTKSASVEVRKIQPSQRNKHCLLETPEGSQVGFVKYNCLSGIFSIARDPKIIYQFLDKFGQAYSETHYILVLVNGFPHGNEKEVLYFNQDFYQELLKARRNLTLPYDTELVRVDNSSVIDIFVDASRAISPYFVVNPETGNLVVEEKDGWDLEYQELLRTGCIEFLGAREEDDQRITIASSVERFYECKRIISSSSEEEVDYYKRIYNFSHCSIDPLQMVSLSTSAAPFFNHQMTPRTTYQASMAKQALGYYNINYHLRKGKFKQLYKAERSLTETDTYFLPCMDLLPCGQIANIAFMCDPDNQEDAVVVAEDYINAGNFNFIRYLKFEVEVTTYSKDKLVIFKKPPLKFNEDQYIYRHLQDNGLPKLDSYIEPNDCILGKVIRTPEGEDNQSHYADLDMRGYVDRILITRDRNNRNPIINIRLRDRKKYQAGDKLALRYAQKGTVGRVAKREDLPVVSEGPNKGITPDVMFNPHGFPTRQTAGLMIEGILNKAALYDGKRRDVSAFRQHDIKGAMEVLKLNGLDPEGYETMNDSKGEPLEDKVFMVPVYEQVLRHHVEEKIQFRNSGSRDFRTHQPRSGKSKGGGIRVGEMEKDAFVAHGASAVIQERLMKSSDEFKLVVCHHCGVIVDAKFCTVCNNSDPVVIVIPYVFKVLIRLLNGVGIDIRLKTEKIARLS